MNQSIKKTSLPGRTRPSPAPQSILNTTQMRPKRCHNCQKMIASDKYQDHIQSCFRYKQGQKIMENNSRAVSIPNTPPSVQKTPSLNKNKSRMMNSSQYKTSRVQQNAHKSRLNVNNNVIIPGKATSNITRKGPHKNIINSTIGQRKYKKNQNPEQPEMKVQEKKQPIELKQQDQKHMKQERFSAQQKQKEQEPEKIKLQKDYTTQSRLVRPASRNIRTHSRPGSASKQTMQIRVAQQNARLASYYNQYPTRLRNQPRVIPQPVEQKQKINHRKVSLSSQSGYQSSQLAVQDGWNQNNSKQKNKVQQQREKIRQRQMESLRERQKQRERQRQLERQRQIRLQQQRQRERQREIQRQRERQRQRQRERQRQRQRERQRERERQRQRQRHREQQITQNDQPRVNLDLLIETTNQIIFFIEQLSINDITLVDMVGQLRQLNAISAQIRQLNGLGRNLGFRMGVVFAQRIQQLQNVIMNQIGVVLIQNFHNNITEDFQRLISMRPTRHSLFINAGFKKEQIQSQFPLHSATTLDQCSICLQDIKVRQQIRQLQCKHNFHPDCIDGWLKQSRKCPMCRHEQKISY